MYNLNGAGTRSAEPDHGHGLWSSVLGPQQWWDGGGASSSSSDGIIAILLGVAAFLLLVGIILLTRMMSEKRRRRQRLLKELSVIDRLLSINRRRLQLIETHAMDYLSALSAEATRALAICKDMILALGQLRTHLGEAVAANEVPALIDAEELLNLPLRLERDALTSLHGSREMPAVFRPDWEKTLDEYFQLIGKEIYRASESAAIMSLTKKDRGTIADLSSAGLRFISEQGRRITRTFRRSLTGRD